MAGMSDARMSETALSIINLHVTQKLILVVNCLWIKMEIVSVSWLLPKRLTFRSPHMNYSSGVFLRWPLAFHFLRLPISLS